MMGNVRVYRRVARPPDPSVVEQVEMNTFVFAAGEHHVELKNPSELFGKDLWIDARITCMDDLGALMVIADAVKACCPARMDLYIPYFPGGRQDKFESGFAATVKIYARIINAMNFNSVTILDPHSPVTGMLIDNVFILPHYGMVQEFLNRGDDAITGLICPDAGAQDRTLRLAKALGVEVIVQANKHRDARTGKLESITMEPLPKPGRYLLSDDICDKGGTFMLLGEVYHDDPNGTGPIDLWITHMVAPGGVAHLFKHFDRVGCTDSFRTDRLRDPKLCVIPTVSPH